MWVEHGTKPSELVDLPERELLVMYAFMVNEAETNIKQQDEINRQNKAFKRGFTS